ncbi:pirin family protein [Kiloniella laminariae]|uniref:pirin family protein n=1 Tax=Kiloniella laminariae TaxID=454162 RepID=UPI00036019FD|nr:pirin family protein [Kiloniella laminariae]
MIDIRPFGSLGRFSNDWLNARYHFSFAGYNNPSRRGIGPLLVWNDDEIQPGSGFPMHGHQDMEIITYVRKGTISHEDHLSNKGLTPAGNIQVMSAGSGILHSEYNHGPEATTLFQIWIQPSVKNLPPRWEQKVFAAEDYQGRFHALASGQQHYPEALHIHQDATLFGSHLAKGESLKQEILHGRQGYLVVAAGQIDLNGSTLGERDAALIQEEEFLELKAEENAEILFLDLPAA